MAQHAARPKRGWKIVGIIAWAVGSLPIGVLIATYLIP